MTLNSAQLSQRLIDLIESNREIESSALISSLKQAEIELQQVYEQSVRDFLAQNESHTAEYLNCPGETSGYTPLMAACRSYLNIKEYHQSDQLVRMLIENGADVNAPDVHGRSSPLIYALKNKCDRRVQLERVKLLLEVPK